MTPDEHLRVPYTMIIASVRRQDGSWIRRAEYPELPDCVAEADSPLDAIDQLDALRVQTILGRLARGEDVPVPRAPLRRHNDVPPLPRTGDDVGAGAERACEPKDSRAAQRVRG